MIILRFAAAAWRSTLSDGEKLVAIPVTRVCGRPALKASIGESCQGTPRPSRILATTSCALNESATKTPLTYFGAETSWRQAHLSDRIAKPPRYGVWSSCETV